MTDLLAEVDEIMKQERIEKLWKAHGNIFITGIVLIILSTAAISGYRSWNSHINTTNTDQILALLEAPDYPANVLDAELDVRPALKGIALLNAASSLLAEDKKDEAQTLYERIAQDSAISKEERQLATLMQMRITSDQGKSLDPMITSLEAIWTDEWSPWRYHAGMELAALYAEEMDFDKAQTYLNTLMDTPALPQSLRNRARALSHIYSLKQASAVQAVQEESESK